jgi:hypothetical protein
MDGLEGVHPLGVIKNNNKNKTQQIVRYLPKGKEK